MILLLLILIHNFRIVRTIEDQTNNEDNATQSNNYQSDVLIADRHDSVISISSNRIMTFCY